ncbi:MAG: hypothetical protein JKX94_12035 [Sneathiella sp.]|nr:hypothetical protein [Sneathiella sp.]
MLANSKQHKREQKQAAVLALFMILAGFIFLAVLTLEPEKNNKDLAVLFPLSMSLKDIVARLAPLPVDMVRTGLFDSIVILKPRKFFPISDLRAVGALLVIDAYASGGCSFLKKKTILSGGKII